MNAAVSVDPSPTLLHFKSQQQVVHLTKSWIHAQMFLVSECQDGMTLNVIREGQNVGGGGYVTPDGYRILGFGDLAEMSFPTEDVIKLSR